ncbi:MAG TPA: PQQ-binding-like beta-propeller repeat protein [Pyrinomonadaceae bacterium]|nr:PQQ-binding-like beta-propeller repeat protein [Pyrinomonadaceae bacterium]
MMFKVPSPCVRAACLLLLLLLPAFAVPPARAQQKQPDARQVNTSILIRWAGKPGVERYRLQLASDAAFGDVVFDQAVVGRQYVVKGLAPGKYFWRVAPAVGETGKFLTTSSVEISESAPGKVEVANVVTPPDIGGWRTATGEVALPVAARLRSGNVFDMLCVNTDGTVYAIDGASGIALWTGRFKPDARRGEETGGGGKAGGFAPLLLSSEGGETSAVVAFDGGVRALRGETGRELWRAKLEGRPASGLATDLNGDGAFEIVVVSNDPDKFYVLDARSGRTLSEKKLEAEAVGAPFPVQLGEVRGVALALKNNRVEIRGADGGALHGDQLKANVTTAPLVVKRGEGGLMVVGTEDGLLALELPAFKLLGRIAVDNDTLRGTISSADLDGDGAPEIILLTKRGRVAMVSTVDGNVKWFAEGATDAASATFADLNADGVLDVVVPGGSAFAIGFSGRDGSLIWKVDEEGGRRAGAANTSPRSLVVAPSSNGGGMVVGSDPSRTGLRAVELPKGSVKTASR